MSNPTSCDSRHRGAFRLAALALSSAFLGSCGGSNAADNAITEIDDEPAQITLSAARGAASGCAGGTEPCLIQEPDLATSAAEPAKPKPGSPIVFNATTSARPGDVVSLQGDSFGNAPRVVLESASTTPLEIVNRVGTHWLAVQIPPTATGALTLRISNEIGSGAPIKLNAARPLHLDTLQLVPGGAFRVFGRNLLAAGNTARVLVNGQAATVDTARSDEHMLTAVAPKSLRASAAVLVLVDNGNGSGAGRLDRPIEVVAATTAADPFTLGVGWGAAFAGIASRKVDAAADPRLTTKVVCDGTRDDTPAIQQAIELAAADGGAVVRLPAGRCRMAGVMNLRSGVVVEGAGRTSTELVYASNYPVYGVNISLAGLRNLTLSNAGASGEGPLLKDSSRVFLQGVGVRLATSRQMYLTGNRHFVVANCDFEQTGSISHQGPYLLNDSAGLVFEGNTTRWMDGAPAFTRVHDSLIRNNRFTRDGRHQNAEGTVHSMTLDFAHRIALVGNTFDVANGPITNTQRNDGETILTEGGGAVRTENLGSVASATATTLSDPATTLLTDPFGAGMIPENYGVAIVGGKGAGQTRRVVAYTPPTIKVDQGWDVVPDSTSRYATFVWGLEKSIIKGNTLSQNPRGIWLYHTAIRDVDVVGNTISEGGGIYLRSYQNLATKSFMPIYNVLIAGNRISNTGGIWMSYINAVFVNADAKAFGIATLGIEMRLNEITANRPNATSSHEEYANVEGIVNMMRVENYDGYESSTVPRLLGSILAGNACTDCEVAVRTGTGAGGTTILNTPLVNTPKLWDDWATTATSEKSTGSVIR